MQVPATSGNDFTPESLVLQRLSGVIVLYGIQISCHFCYHAMYSVVLSRLAINLAEKENVTEELKAADQK